MSYIWNREIFPIYHWFVLVGRSDHAVHLQSPIQNLIRFFRNKLSWKMDPQNTNPSLDYLQFDGIAKRYIILTWVSGSILSGIEICCFFWHSTHLFPEIIISNYYNINIICRKRNLHCTIKCEGRCCSRYLAQLMTQIVANCDKSCRFLFSSANIMINWTKTSIEPRTLNNFKIYQMANSLKMQIFIENIFNSLFQFTTFPLIPSTSELIFHSECVLEVSKCWWLCWSLHDNIRFFIDINNMAIGLCESMK